MIYYCVSKASLKAISLLEFPLIQKHTVCEVTDWLCSKTPASKILWWKPQSFVFAPYFNWERLVWLNVIVMNLTVCLYKAEWESKREEEFTTTSINLLSLLILNSAMGAVGSHSFLSDIMLKTTSRQQRPFQICSLLPAVCLWQGQRRLTSVLRGVAWGSWPAQLEIQQIYLDHEDKVVHLENDCDSVQPWCPLQLHRRAWPG